MQVPESWLRTMVDPALTTEALAHLLTMSGIEVEAIDPVAPAFSMVLVGQVLEVAGHPNADKLTVCKVDAGQGSPLSIVCGAPNVAAGIKAPVALVGAALPGIAIKQTAVRGVESNGMLCSARELGLSDDHSGLLVLPADATIGGDVRELLGLEDQVLTIKLTPNRADCLSVLGIAREVAALTSTRLTPPDTRAIPRKIDATFPVKISDSSGCGRFAGRVIRNVNAAAPTPEWMKRRLERSGQRSISALVDVTNYVMLELGRPLHVYDLDKLKGGIDVRFGRGGEHVKLLNEQTVEVYPDVLAITDASGPIGLAGIMGGDSTKADLDTGNVFLESAFFFPEAIVGRARRYNFTSDASHRFERGVDFENEVQGIERATALILEICGGEPGPTVDTVAKLPERKPVRMRVARAQKIIGVAVPADEMADIFRRLGLAATRSGRGADETFAVTPPSYRFDIEIEEDLIEEVARVHGFDRIPAHPPVVPAIMHARAEGRRSLHDLRAQLARADYQEVVNFSFVDEAWEDDLAGNATPIRLLNPIASQLAVMRTTLVGGLVANVRYNLNRKVSRVRVFEIGRVFARDPSVQDGELDVAGIRQPTHVGAIAYGPAYEEQWGVRPTRTVDFFDLKGDVELLVAPRQPRFVKAAHPALHPGRSARIELDGVGIGWIGELHPEWQQKYELPGSAVVFEMACDPLLTVPLPRYSEVSKFPAVIRDLAVVVGDDVPADALLDALRGARPGLAQEVWIFDLYRGESVGKGRKSLAFRVVMQDTERTLTDAEVDAAMAQLAQLLRNRFGAERRS
jgi:phenylalanyl-tRNA synthetase beta chain